MRMRETARLSIPSDAYSLYVRQAPRGSFQVFSLDYGDKMRVYDSSGSLKSSMHWSSEVRCIAVGDVEGQGQDALVGGTGNKVLVVDNAGKTLWNINLESGVVGCDARDVDGDDAAEIVVALENRRVVLWNDDKTVLFSRTMDSPVADVWLEEITGDSELEVAVADHHGTVTILTAAGFELKRLQLGTGLTVFGVLSFKDRKFFVTGEHSNTLKIWDIEGRQVESIELTEKPRALATASPRDVSDVAYLVVSSADRKLTFWQIEDTGNPSKDENLTLQQLKSTRQEIYKRAVKCGNCGAPALPESERCAACGAVLEVIPEYKTDEFIKESIESITFRHQRIRLKDLDCILRRTLPKPVAYNLRVSLQTMVENKEIQGHFEADTFVRTIRVPMLEGDLIEADVIAKMASALPSLLQPSRRFDIDVLESSTGVPERIIRYVLLILLGEGLIEGRFSGREFVLSDKQNIQDFVRKLQNELRMINQQKPSLGKEQKH
jgi:predicted transcriptional regulator